jgi:hypothetical protein
LGLLYTTSIQSTNVAIIADYMIEECRNQPETLPRPHSVFENLVMFLASSTSSEREIASKFIAGVAKINEWAVFFFRYRPLIQVSDASSFILPTDNLALIPALLHSAAQSQFPIESHGAISALALLSEHEDHLCEILAQEPSLDRLLSVIFSESAEASTKTSIIFCNLAACSKTQSSIGLNQPVVLSLAEILPQNISIDDNPRVRNIIKCFHHISKSNDLDQLSALCQSRVLLQTVLQFGGSSSFHICEFLLNICHAFSLNSEILDRVVRAGTISTLMTGMVTKNFESRVVACCFELLNRLKTLPGVLSQFFDNVSFIEMVCTSIYPNDMLEAALLLLDLSACKEHRHRLFTSIRFVKESCKFLLRSNRQPQHGIMAAQEICIGANILSNLAEDYCHLDDFSSFFNYFPEHMWYKQNFMNTEMSQNPNAQVQECCSRAIYTLCEGEEDCFQLNQVACANSCLSQLYGLLEFGASDLAKINSARSLCAITALYRKKEIRALLSNKISPAQLWHVPLLVIRQRDPADAVRFCLGLISHLVEDPGRGSELAMVPVEKLGGVTKHIEWYAIICISLNYFIVIFVQDSFQKFEL